MRTLMLGAGGHARSVADALGDLVLDGVVLRELDEDAPRNAMCELDLLELDPADVRLVNGIGQVVAYGPRWDAFHRMISAGFSFLTVVHPTAYVSPSAQIEQGAQILARSVIGPFAVVGANSIVNTGAVIEHDCRLGPGVHVGPGSVLCGDVLVGEGAMVGAGATVIPGRRLGLGSQLGAGSVLVQDLEPHARALGVPARPRP